MNKQRALLGSTLAVSLQTCAEGLKEIWAFIKVISKGIGELENTLSDYRGQKCGSTRV
jgi:hypothetical protein